MDWEDSTRFPPPKDITTEVFELMEEKHIK